MADVMFRIVTPSGPEPVEGDRLVFDGGSVRVMKGHPFDATTVKAFGPSWWLTAEPVPPESQRVRP